MNSRDRALYECVAAVLASIFAGRNSSAPTSREAYLENASLIRAHFEGADLREATDLDTKTSA
jgi:uncharacterized protein YjbI with pentapeptide repeats